VSDQDNGPRSRLEERLGAQKLRDRMGALRKETGGLLDGSALLALVADEEGLAETHFAPLSELDPSRPVFTRCVVDKVEPAREFQFHDRTGKLRKLRVSDATGSLTLTLWDEETGLVEQLGLRKGSAIRILSATLRETRFGREIHVGKTGFIVPEDALPGAGPSGPANPGNIRDAPGRVDVRGVILSLNTTGRGREKTTSIRLFDGTGECELVIPHEQLAPPDGLAQGTEIELSAALADHPDGKTVLRCDGRSALKII
jgi:hypothetical protein